MERLNTVRTLRVSFPHPFVNREKNICEKWPSGNGGYMLDNRGWSTDLRNDKPVGRED